MEVGLSRPMQGVGRIGSISPSMRGAGEVLGREHLSWPSLFCLCLDEGNGLYYLGIRVFAVLQLGGYRFLSVCGGGFESAFPCCAKMFNSQKFSYVGACHGMHSSSLNLTSVFSSPELAPLFPFLIFFGGPFVFHSPGKKDIFCWGPIFPA